MLLASADLYPTLDATVGANRDRSTQVGGNPLPPGFSAYSTNLAVGLQASYEVDLWGKYRTRDQRAAKRDLLASEFGREDDSHDGRSRHRTNSTSTCWPPTSSCGCSRTR